jgi:hypothetical protein
MTNYAEVVVSVMVESMKEAGVTNEQFEKINKIFVSKMEALSNE